MTADSASSSSWTTVHDSLQDSDNRATDCFRRTQWDQICQIASRSNHNLACVALDQVASGLNNIVRLLEFTDGSRWAARVCMKRHSSQQGRGIAEFEAEIAAMQLIKQHSNLAVPRVFAHDARDDDNEKNPAGVAYMLIEVLPGIVAMDALGGYDVHRGVIPLQFRQRFYRPSRNGRRLYLSQRFKKGPAIVKA